jgi:CubicO group peptidase (beta-lactamase class C family)
LPSCSRFFSLGAGVPPTVETDGLAALLDDHVDRGAVPGAVALIGRGDAIHVHVAGVRDLESGAPMERNTIFAVASIGSCSPGWRR